MTDLNSTFVHIPVLYKEVLVALCVQETHGKFLDCTFGGGGHTSFLLNHNKNNIVYAIDRDLDALNRAKKLKQEFLQRFFFYSMNFADISNLCLPSLDGILLDLGVSSYQLDDAVRGFSFKYHTRLDMRMNTSDVMTASAFLNVAAEDQLIQAIRDFGEEKHWRKIVNTILNNRGTDNLLYADLLAKLIKQSLPKEKNQKIHPATKIFQGIRIAINGELEALIKALPELFNKLKIGGRLVVISFHSLEDRIIKQFFKKMAGVAINRNDFEPSQNKKKLARIINSKPIVSTDEEIKLNPRSRSAKLRILEKMI